MSCNDHLVIYYIPRNNIENITSISVDVVNVTRVGELISCRMPYKISIWCRVLELRDSSSL